MTTIQIEQVPVSDDPELGPLWDQIAAVVEATDVDLYGHADLCDPGRLMQQQYLMQTDTTKITLVARDDSGTVVGYASVRLPVNDNTDMAQVGVWVHPQHQRAGIGGRLLAETELVVRDAGRHRITGWTGHRHEVDADDPDAVPAPTGVGVLSRTDPVVRFALAHDYVLEQTERHSQMPMPVPAETLDPLRDKAVAASAGYRVVSWVGRTPAEYVAGKVVLHTRMSTDVPMGALDFEEEVWDEARLRRMEDNEIALGYRGYETCAQEIATGELVAYTRMVTSDEKPEVGYQEDTLVRSEHRGHRLGLLIKVANAEAMAAAEPKVRRVHTWNAGENQWMLAINVAMGFRRATTEGAWQKRL